MGDIHYTNLMIEFEKLNCRLDSLEEKLGEINIETLERRVKIVESHVDTTLKEKYYGKCGPNTPVVVEDFSRSFHPDAVGVPKVQPEDFSRFLDFDKLKEEKGFE